MKISLRGVGAVVVLAVIGLGLYAARLVRSLGTPEFKARAAQEASAVLGARVRLASLDVSLLRGVRFTGVSIQNPPGFAGDLLSVEEARLSYDLWPLLRGRIRLDELSLRKPAITLATDGRGTYNYQKLSALASRPPTKSSPVPAATSLLGLVISKLSVADGRFALVDEKKVAVLRLEGGSLDSALAAESGGLEGTGKAGFDSVVFANALFLRGVRTPIRLTRERMSLAPLQAKLAGGAVTGEIEIHFKPLLRYTLRVATSGASVATLLREAGSAAAMTGTLDARARVEGTGGLLTVSGGGEASIKDCRWQKAPLFGLLAGLLQIAELRDPRFDECRVEFTLRGGQARTPVVSFKGPALELTGQGAANLLTSAIDYDLTLALSPGLLAKIPAAMRAGFKTRADGFGTIPFKVDGALGAPRTDLPARLGKTMAIEAAKEGLLGRLFGKRTPQ